MSTVKGPDLVDETCVPAKKACINKWNGRPYSQKYYEILEIRKTLPVWEIKEEFFQALKANQSLILVGETGSGKTTQIPQFVLDAVDLDTPDKYKSMMIACTQPHRNAAISMARRVAEEMDLTIGKEVSYTIQFEDCSSSKTIVKYLTDGMLLREAMTDPLLECYRAIILDEVHKRTSATDTALIGLLKEVLKNRPDMKLVVMSASTLEAEKFQDYFDGAPLMKVPRRLHLIKISYTQAQVRDNGADTDLRCSDDILTEILIRLPLKLVFRCKCVSKRWHHLISNPSFRDIYSTSPHCEHLVGFFQTPAMERLVYFRPIKKKKGTARKRGSRCIKRQTFEFLATSPPSRVTCSAVEGGGGGGGDFISLESSQQIVNSLGNIICSSNGLLLCGIHPRTYYIFNPVTKESYQLPPPPGKNWEPSTCYIMGLVAANCADVSTTSSIRYKVVHADTRSRDAVSGNKVKIGTFSSETGKWRQSMVPLTGTGNYYCLDSLRKTTVIRGAIHWVAFHIGVYDPYKVDGHMEMIATPPFQFIHECVMGESTDNLLQIAVFTDTLTSIQV